MDTTALGFSLTGRGHYLLEVFLGLAAFMGFVVLGDGHWLCREVNREMK